MGLRSANASAFRGCRSSSCCTTAGDALCSYRRSRHRSPTLHIFGSACGRRRRAGARSPARRRAAEPRAQSAETNGALASAGEVRHDEGPRCMSRLNGAPNRIQIGLRQSAGPSARPPARRADARAASRACFATREQAGPAEFPQALGDERVRSALPTRQTERGQRSVARFSMGEGKGRSSRVFTRSRAGWPPLQSNGPARSTHCCSCLVVDSFDSITSNTTVKRL